MVKLFNAKKIKEMIAEGLNSTGQSIDVIC